MKLLAKTFTGLEEILQKEIEKLGGQNAQKQNRAVSFEGDRHLLYKANYTLRTALKILLPISDFEFANIDEFYEKIYQIEWEKYFTVSKSIQIDPVVNSELFNNTHFAALKAKDAIVDRFTNKTGKRPNVDTKSPEIIINLYIKDNYCNVTLDTSGEPLFKRGYRTRQVEAPINEVLAAGLIQLSEWNTKKPLIDFMCGSGTLPIEAAMLAYNIPAQILRKNFAFQNFNDFDKSIWVSVVNQAKENQSTNSFKIFASDVSPKAVDISAQNMANLGLSAFIDLKKRDFINTSYEKPAHIIFNPPYWKRIYDDQQSVEEFYKSIGDTLKNNYKGSEAWLFTGNLNALKSIGLKTAQKIILYNGPIESRLVKYELY